MTNDVVAALAVLTFTPHIRRYLRRHDPKALEQADAALQVAGVRRSGKKIQKVGTKSEVVA